MKIKAFYKRTRYLDLLQHLSKFVQFYFEMCNPKKLPQNKDQVVLINKVLRE